MQSFQRVLSDRAIDDLADIYEYIASENPAAAEHFVDTTTDKISNLASTGNRGVARENIAEGLRAFPFKHRCNYFRIVDDKFYVLSVLLERRDITPELFKD